MKQILKFLYIVFLHLFKILLYILAIIVILSFYFIISIVLKNLVNLLDRFSLHVFNSLKNKIISYENEEDEKEEFPINENTIKGITGMIVRRIPPTVENLKTTLKINVNSARKIRTWLEVIEVIYSDRNNNNKAVISDIFMHTKEDDILSHLNKNIELL